ncbi:MAG: SEC-C metal-binding domain-containing protein [Bacilli bacterium]|nr:SEC-C metal-binding domain-containing protein [Bacilli bacterium]
MELKQIINIYGKETIYRGYSNLVENPKEYKKITKYQMVLDIYKMYNDNPQSIIDVCSFEELALLKKILNKKTKTKPFLKDWKDDDYSWLKLLREKFLLSYEPISEFERVPKEIKSSIEEALNNLDEDAIKKRDELNYLIVGLIRAYHNFTLDDFYVYFSEYHNMSYIDFKNYLSENTYFKPYIYIDNENEPILCFSEEYRDFADDIFYNFNENSHLFNYKYKKNELISIGRNKINLENPHIKRFVLFLKENLEYSFQFDMLLDSFIIQAGISLDNGFFMFLDILSDYIKINEDTVDILLEISTEAYNNMPNWTNNGVPPYHAAQQMINEKSDNPSTIVNENNKIGRNDPCHCGSGKKYKKCCLNEKYLIKEQAMLSYDDAILFYKLFVLLCDFTNKKYNIVKEAKKPEDFYYKNGNVIADYTVKIREKMWEDKNIIKEFLVSTSLTEEESVIVKSWEKRITGNFVIYKYEKGLAYIMDDNNIYAVAGISNPISEKFPAHLLPVLLKITLLPFKNKIIYDSFLETMNITMGAGMVKMHDKIYDELKDNIITKL